LTTISKISWRGTAYLPSTRAIVEDRRWQNHLRRFLMAKRKAAKKATKKKAAKKAKKKK
jgi:hypothetical protein